MRAISFRNWERVMPLEATRSNSVNLAAGTGAGASVAGTGASVATADAGPGEGLLAGACTPARPAPPRANEWDFRQAGRGGAARAAYLGAGAAAVRLQHVADLGQVQLARSVLVKHAERNVHAVRRRYKSSQASAQKRT